MYLYIVVPPSLHPQLSSPCRSSPCRSFHPLILIYSLLTVMVNDHLLYILLLIMVPITVYPLNIKIIFFAFHLLLFLKLIKRLSKRILRINIFKEIALQKRHFFINIIAINSQQGKNKKKIQWINKGKSVKVVHPQVWVKLSATSVLCTCPL